jgi:hypothetical protein
MFAFIESFFLLSLGITFIMIFLMVFHFKQRIEKLERKNNDLSDLTNKIIKEVTNLQFNMLQSSHNHFQPQNLKQPKEHICENIRISTSIPIPVSFTEEEIKKEEEPTYKKIIVMDNIINDDIIIADEFSDNDSNSSSSSFNYDDSDSDMEIENFEKEDQIHYIKLEEIEQPQKKEPEQIQIQNQNQLNYNKMTVSNLKILAISKGLCSDTSKIKRADLVKLLEENET